MNNQKQKLLLEYLISSPDVYSICESVIDPRYFDVELRSTVALIKNYFIDYRAVPSADVIRAETGVALSERTVTRDQTEYCIQEVEKFCRQRAITRAIGECGDLLAQEEYGEIEKRLRDAIAVSITKDLGISIFDDPGAILRKIAETQQPISTAYEELDKKLFGGLVRKTLTVISGPSGGGKSLTMANLAMNYCETGHTVLYVTMEMSEELNYLRFASMISAVSQNGWFMHIDEIAERVGQYQSVYGGGTRGNLFIKKLPMHARPSQVRAVIKEFELTHGSTPDVLIVDYLDIMMPDVKVAFDNISLRDKFVAEGVRALADEYNMIAISGSQLTKDAQDEDDIGVSQIGGGQTKINTADVWMTVILNDEMKAAGMVGFKFLKTRSSDGKNQFAFLQFDAASLRYRNLNDKVDDNIVKQLISRNKKRSGSKQDKDTPPNALEQAKGSSEPTGPSVRDLLGQMTIMDDDE